MKTLNESYNEVLKQENEPDVVFIRILNEQLSKVNISLTKRQEKNIIKKLKLDNVSINITDSQVKKSGYSEKYLQDYIENVFDTFGELIADYEDKMIEIIPDITVNISDEFSERIYRRLKKTFKGIKRNRKKIHHNFEKDVYKHWKNSFDFMDMILFMTREIIESLDEVENDKTPKRNLLLAKLMSKGCLIYSEIITLLKNGFPDGAYTRWRSLHEITVLAEFISDKSEEVAMKYFEHQYVQDYKHAKRIMEESNNLFQYEITEDEYAEIKENYNLVIEKYGKKFIEDYGWANSLLDKKRIYFSDIEKTINYENIRSHYRMSSDSIHTNSRGLFYNIGLIDNFDNELLIGPSVVGFGIPIGLAVTSIVLLNTNVLININNEVLMDDLVYMKVLTKFREEIVPKCFDEERVLFEKMF